VGGGAVPPSRADVYAGLRSLALGVDPATLALTSRETWSGAFVAVMEIGLPTAVVSFVAIADGTVSMYTSVGGGVIGAGAHASVRASAARFRTIAGETRGLLEKSTDFPLPGPGQVRFQVRTADGDYSGTASEQILRAGRHSLSRLYQAGQDLVTEIRLSTPN
jgi:hypothetical protein